MMFNATTHHASSILAPCSEIFVDAQENMSYNTVMKNTIPFEEYIGKQVFKQKSGKPFKSRNKINTVKGIINHHQLNVPAFTFFEDDSYVDCRKCCIVEETAV
jgi:hypothetical protein